MGLSLEELLGSSSQSSHPASKAGDVAAFAAPDGGVTPMMAAASGGHEAVVELLLQRGSNPTRRDAKGRSAAAYARAAGHTHLAARLYGVVDLDKTLR